MHYAAMRQYDIANGVGIRTSLFVSGCTHRCKGCFNTAYKDFNYGTKWDKTAKETFLAYATNQNVHGVTILGGEPMDQIMDNDLLDLLSTLKQETDHTIWLYSGYTFEEILVDSKRSEILSYCDVLVDGPFIEAEKDIRLQFRGSRNQRILDVQPSLLAHTPIVWQSR
jgi:anaerobic ribonucleoside-triphosphate reductase activating protein